ncbi:MAG: ZIP family metal transporter [Mahellales bacterium]
MLEVLSVSLIAGLATGLGAIPVIIFKNIPHRVYDALLGFAAGIMLAAATFSLILPALREGGIMPVITGIILSALFIFLVEKAIPHLHPHFSSNGDEKGLSMRRGILMAAAIAIHNFPEGLSVGVGFGSGKDNLGLILAIAIAIHNIPEGLAVAAPLRKAGLSRTKSLIITALSGLVEPVAAIIGISLMSISQAILPFGLAFAGGAMIYVVSDELIPECHSHGHETEATFGVIAGFLAMILIEYLL